MADNTTIVKARSGTNIMRKIFAAIGISANGSISGIGHAKKKAWRCSGAPTVDSGSQATYPVGAGDYLYDYTNSDGYTCTVAPAASTNGTFVKLHA